MSELQHLLDNNREWAARVTSQDPRFFAELAEQQTPQYLWIGCSDSRVSANVIVDLAPGEVFVHRNVANLVVHTDMNCLSVIQFAVEVLKVRHVIVCGHYGCGGVIAALENGRHGLIDNWLRHIQDTASKHSAALNVLSDEASRINKVCELNVIENVVNVGETTIIRDAWGRGQDLTIHGWIYDLKDGIMSDLGISISGEGPLEHLRQRTFAEAQPTRSADSTS
jgi:carbonic anhydrase